MGTSKSQPSPNTPNWRAAQLAYTNPNVSIDRAVQEIWRAATNQPAGDLAALLAQPVVAECFQAARGADSRAMAVELASRHVAQSGEASLAAVMAQRAVALSYGTENSLASFTTALFSEAGNYLVARDLPGFIGASGRAKTLAEGIALKHQIRSRIAAQVEDVRRPAARNLAKGWSAYVSEVIARLRATGER